MYTERVVCSRKLTSLTLEKPVSLMWFTDRLVSQASYAHPQRLLSFGLDKERQSTFLAAVLASFAVRKACLTKVANPVSSSLGVSGVGSVIVVVGAAAVHCGAGLLAKRLSKAAAYETASLKQPMHAVVVPGQMAPNACCKPVPKLAIGSSPTAHHLYFENILWFLELYVRTEHGRVGNRKVKYTMVE